MSGERKKSILDSWFEHSNRAALPKGSRMFLRRIRERDQPVDPSGFSLGAKPRGRSGGACWRDEQSIGGVLAGAPNRRRKRHSVATLLLFAAVFTGLGLFFWLDFGLIPLWQVARSCMWTASPAVVTESGAKPYARGGILRICYEYRWENQLWQGERYDFFLSRFDCGSGSGSRRAEVISDFPVGKPIECLVNPDDPAESVISRAIPWCAWGGILLPPVFIVIGIAAGWQALRNLQRKLRSGSYRKIFRRPKFFKDRKNWKNELAAVGLAAGTVMFFLSFFVLGDPTVWRLVSCIPLLLPLFFGPWLKMKLPALLLVVLAGLQLWHAIETRKSVISVSPGGTVVRRYPRGNRGCWIVMVDGQRFDTGASIYHKARVVWRNENCFILDSSDIGPTEFRRESGVWKASPEAHLHRPKENPTAPAVR